MSRTTVPLLSWFWFHLWWDFVEWKESSVCGCVNSLGFGHLHHCRCHQVQVFVLSQQVCNDRPGSLDTGLKRLLDISSRVWA